MKPRKKNSSDDELRGVQRLPDPQIDVRAIREPIERIRVAERGRRRRVEHRGQHAAENSNDVDPQVLEEALEADVVVAHALAAASTRINIIGITT